jgi:hypothetical protein
MTTIDKVPFKVDFKVMTGIITGVLLIAGLYWNLQNQVERAQEISRENNAILREMERVNSVRVSALEIGQAEMRIRITGLENLKK